MGNVSNNFFRTTQRTNKLKGYIFFGIIDCDFLQCACLGFYDAITMENCVFQL